VGLFYNTPEPTRGVILGTFAMFTAMKSPFGQLFE